MRLFFLHKLYPGYYAKIHSPSSIFLMKHHSLVPLPGVVDRFPLPFNLLQLLVECKVFVCLGLYWVPDIVCKKLMCSPVFVNLWLCCLGENCWFVKCVFYFLNTWHVCMTGLLAGKGKSCFPCILSVYWGVDHRKNTFSTTTISIGICMDMYGYPICLIYLMCKLSGGFRHMFVVVFGVDFVNSMNFKVVGDNWKLAKALVRAKIEDLGLPSFLITPAKFNSSPLKNDAWKTILSYSVPVTFQGRTVKLRGGYFCEHIWPTCLPKQCHFCWLEDLDAALPGVDDGQEL